MPKLSLLIDHYFPPIYLSKLKLELVFPLAACANFQGCRILGASIQLSKQNTALLRIFESCEIDDYGNVNECDVSIQPNHPELYERIG